MFHQYSGHKAAALRFDVRGAVALFAEPGHIHSVWLVDSLPGLAMLTSELLINGEAGPDGEFGALNSIGEGDV